jgi:hypothetical protein
MKSAVILLSLWGGLPLAAGAQTKCPTDRIFTSVPRPKLDKVTPKSTEVTGKVDIKNDDTGTVQLCLNNAPLGDATKIEKDGKFSVKGLTELKKGQTITAQFTLRSGEESKVGAESDSVTVSEGEALSKAVLIGGVEQSGYSSLAQNTNAFVNILVEGPEGRISGWGKVRLLSTPQPSTQGIVSTFSDPTGQLMSLDYKKVGEGLDFVIGPKIEISKRWSFIAEFGGTTPLNSQTATLTYVVPDAGTVECTTLVNRFSAKNGYDPGLTAAPAGSTSCLAGNYKNVAFTNRDRSNFYLKYGAGFRTANKFDCSGDCTPA